MSDLLATLLSGIGAGAQQYGKGLGDRAMADQEEKKAMQRTLKMQAIKDGMNYEKQRALISATRPELLDTYDRVTHQSGILRPLDDSDLKMLDQHLSAKKAQEQLDAMQVNPQTQSAMGNAARMGGLESPLGVTPQTPSAGQAYQMDYSTFAEPAQQQANQQMQSDNPPSMNRAGMSDASMGSSLATAVDIYMKKKMQAEKNRVALQAKSANELSRLKEPTETALAIKTAKAKERAGVKSDGEYTDLEKDYSKYLDETGTYNRKAKEREGLLSKMTPGQIQEGIAIGDESVMPITPRKKVDKEVFSIARDMKHGKTPTMPKTFKGGKDAWEKTIKVLQQMIDNGEI